MGYDRQFFTDTKAGFSIVGEYQITGKDVRAALVRFGTLL